MIYKYKQTGFTLIEVLVAMVIMAVGLLGIVTMHGNAMFFTKDTESQWLASEAVFGVFETMRPRLRAAVDGQQTRVTSANAVANSYLVPGPGGVNGNCPAVIATAGDELACIQSILQVVLPGGRIESITLSGATLLQGLSIQVSWLASFAAENEEAKCDAMRAVDTEVTDGDSSINASILASSDCSDSTGLRKVAHWVMLP